MIEQRQRTTLKEDIGRIIDELKQNPDFQKYLSRIPGICIYGDIACSPSGGEETISVANGETFSMTAHLPSNSPFLNGLSPEEQGAKLADLPAHLSERSRMVLAGIDGPYDDVVVNKIGDGYDVEMTFCNMGPTPIRASKNTEMVTLFDVVGSSLSGFELFEVASQLSDNLDAVQFINKRGDTVTFSQIIEKISNNNPNNDQLSPFDPKSPDCLLHVFLPYKDKMGFPRPLAVNSLADLPPRRDGLLETHTDWFNGKVPIAESEMVQYETEAGIEFVQDAKNGLAIVGLILPNESDPAHSRSALLHNGHTTTGYHYNWPIIGEHRGTGYPKGFVMDLYWQSIAA